MRSRKLLTVLAVLGGLLPWTAAWACGIPVFRFALERWRPDAYEVIVFHQGPLSAEDKKLVEHLSEAREDSKAPANIEVTAVDMAGDVPAALRKLWQSQKDATLPWMIVRYPASLGIEKPIWAGEPTKEIVQALVQSPARREIAKRLLNGESTVWLIIETGDKKLDDATAELVQTELNKHEKGLEQTLKQLLQGDKQPERGRPAVKLLSELPLQVSFSVLRVSRDDPAELFLLAMLLNVDEDFAKMKGLPVMLPIFGQGRIEEAWSTLLSCRKLLMFPIFGRGRALDGFAGKGINAEHIGGVARFLCGDCNCEIKAACPGADMLFAANWDSILSDERPAPEPSRKPGVLVAIPKPTVKPVPAPVVAEVAVKVPESMDMWRYLWVVIPFVALMLLVSVTLLRDERRSST